MSQQGLAATLRSGETLLGAWCALPGPGPAEFLAAGGVDEIAVIAQIESAAAVECVEEIAQVEGVAAVADDVTLLREGVTDGVEVVRPS